MQIYIVTNVATDWSADIPGVEVVDARRYLTEPEFSEQRGVRVFNLCRSYRYQSTGYYVSLLAEARGHKPLPNVATVRDLKNQTVVRMASDELDELMQKSLAPIRSDRFVLSIYFGQNLAKRYERLAQNLFMQFQSPLLRAHFYRTESGWQLKRVEPISANEVPENHWPFVVDTAKSHFANRRLSFRKSMPSRYDMAILYDPKDPEPPSNQKALDKFVKAAGKVGISAELITRDDFGRLAEYDALFIRETTYINNHSYRFSRKAAGEGLVVIDDPISILRCTNKVYLAELLGRHKVPIPRTIVAHRDNAASIGATLGFPVVLKKPDSAFSRGVIKVENEAELAIRLKEFFEESDLVVAQEFLPTTFDWRIGIIDGHPLFACRYFMADGHWQIIHSQASGDDRYGRYETIPVEMAPQKAVQLALKSANLIGDGLYGVDVKESGGKFYIIEVNDNPNIDAGVEDEVLKDELYQRIISVFLRRIEKQKSAFRY